MGRAAGAGGVPSAHCLTDEDRRGVGGAQRDHEGQRGEVDRDLVTGHRVGADPAHHQRHQRECAELEQILAPIGTPSRTMRPRGAPSQISGRTGQRYGTSRR